MNLMPSTPLKLMALKIAETIAKEFQTNIEASEIYNMIGETPNKEMGHFAFPCFTLAKSLRKGPPQIAGQLASSIGKNEIGEFKAVGPYLNLNLSPLYFAQAINNEIKDDSYFHKKFFEKSSRIMIEYSQPNTHKDLHVGHMRNLCLGNALVRLNRYIGQEVIATTYPGDVGTHVAKCLWYLKHHYTGPWPKDDLGTWLGKMYTAANNKLEDERGTDKEEGNRVILTAILKELEEKKGPYFDLWKETRLFSLKLFEETYAWADVKFDRWYFESEVDSESLMFAKNLYNQGKLTLSEGAIGMDLNEENLGFCMLIKSDGTGLYATKDIMLAQKKFAEYKLDRNIYLVDKRQAFHFKQVFKTLEKLEFAHAKDCEHLEYDFVELPSGPMSSRKGNVIPLKELVVQMESAIENNYLAKYRGEWSEAEIKKTASQIAAGAIKYGMVRLDNNKKIVFDMDEWTKLDGETGPYLQYVSARISSLLLKQNYDEKSNAKFLLLTTSAELELIAKLTRFNDTVFSAATQFKTGTLCSYLYDLGKLFNHFYVECPIGKADNEDLKIARLHLCAMTKRVMIHGMALLGIEAPNRM